MARRVVMIGFKERVRAIQTAGYEVVELDAIDRLSSLERLDGEVIVILVEDTRAGCALLAEGREDPVIIGVKNAAESFKAWSAGASSCIIKQRITNDEDVREVSTDDEVVVWISKIFESMESAPEPV